MLLSEDDIKTAGFVGFRTIRDLRSGKLADVPAVQGVYLVIRLDHSPPRFLPTSTGGRFKGKDPTVDVGFLRDAWITDSLIIYIGKAGGAQNRATLRSRIKAYVDFGHGVACGHWGGRYIWQLKDAESLVVCWKETPGDEPRKVEKQFIEEFKSAHNKKRPYANRAG